MYNSNMTKKILINELCKLDSDLTDLLKYIAAKEELNLPGSLTCAVRGKKTEYYQMLENGKTVFLGNDKEALRLSLAKKKHYQKMADTAEREKQQIARCLKALKGGRGLSDIDDVYPSLPSGIQVLTGPFTITDDGYASKWYRSNRKGRNQTRSVRGQLVTQKGDIVKSKSELIIADRLDSAGVPYIYEYTTGLSDGDYIFHPDFLVLNKRTRQQFFWEHCGKMDDPSYCAETQYRLDKYAQNGYFPGKNMIFTYESSKLPLSTGYVDMLIKEFLL